MQPGWLHPRTHTHPQPKEGAAGQRQGTRDTEDQEIGGRRQDVASGLNPVLARSSPSSSRSGHLPTDCRVATRLPAGTPPPLAMAVADIILAAREEAAIPALVKPMAPSTTGTAPTATTVGRGV